LKRDYSMGSFMVSTDKSRLDLKAIHGFLKDTYWAKDISFEAVRKSIRESLCFGVYKEDELVGFARVITDHVAFAYLVDLFILETHRGRGLAKWLLECILSNPELRDVRMWLLATRDAHALYKKFGFKPLTHPERFMRLSKTDVNENTNMG
jgi:GNAT superfamily N-acetyltransferase